jgi:RHS repeat-associated protein
LVGNQTSVTDPLNRTTNFTYDAMGHTTSITDPLNNVTTFGYDETGNQTSITDALDRQTKITYDALSRPTVITDPLGNKTNTSYDAVGNIIDEVDGLGRKTRYQYDDRNLPTSVTDPEGNKTTSSYDKVGNLTSISDANGYTTTYQYDKLSRRSKVIDALGNETKYTYDKEGNQTQLIDPLGRTTNYTYDALNRQTGITDALNNKTTYTYDPVGNQTSITDPLNRTTTYTYDNLNRTQKVTDAMSGVTTNTYDAVGNQISVTDPMGRKTNLTYDKLNRNTSVIDPLGHTTTNTYDGVSNLITTNDALSNQTKYTYDKLNRKTVVTNPENQTVTTNYDAVGNAIALTDELGRTTSFTYDGRNLQTGIIDPLLNKTTTNYDEVGNVVSVEDPNGNSTSYSYDGLGRKISDVDAIGGITSYTYDAGGNLLSLTDPNNNKTSYTYDRLNRMVTDTNQLNKSRTYTYDAVGNQIQVKDRNDRIRKFVYDKLDRNTRETWVDGSNNPVRAIDYQYNPVGELTKVTDPSATYSYTYDAAGRNIGVDNTGTPGVPNVKFDYSYDAVNNLVQTKDAINGTASGTTNYVYDALNRATQINQSGNGVADKRVDLTYDAASQMTGMNRYSDLDGNNQVASSDYQYDAAGRLTDLKHSHNGNTIADYGWEYDKGSRITKSIDPDGTSDYNYDKTNQLTGTDNSDRTDESFQYDSNGNRKGSGYSTGVNNQLLSNGTYNYEYDGEGNRTKRTEIATGKVDEYVWDYRNRLVSVVTRDSSGNVINKKSDYTYDAFDKRISKSVDADGDGSGSATVEKYVYDGDNLALVFDGEGNQKERFLHGRSVDSVIAQENADGQVLWALSDNQGSVRDVIDSNGNVLNHLVYDSFGRVIGETNPGVNFRFGYTGQELDPETGLNYYGRRLYDPGLGIFISPDPTGFSAGDANLYRYVRNNPVNFVDPFGLCGVDNFDFLSGDDSGGIQKIHADYAKLLAEYDLDGNPVALNEEGFGFDNSDSFKIAQGEDGIGQFIWDKFIKEPLIDPALAALLAGLGLATDYVIKGSQDFADSLSNSDFSFSDFTSLFGDNSNTSSSFSQDKAPFHVVDPSLFDPNNLNKNKDYFKFDKDFNGSKFPKSLFDQQKQEIFKFPGADPLSGKPNIETFPKGGDDLFTPYLEIGTYDDSQGLSPVNKPDAAADALAQKLGGQSRVKFNSDPNERDFDTITDQYVAQTKPGLQNLSKKERNQAKETFEAASQTGREVYYEFESQPTQKVIDKLREYEQRYQIKLTIDILNK